MLGDNFEFQYLQVMVRILRIWALRRVRAWLLISAFQTI